MILVLVWGLEFQGEQSEIGELDILDAGSPGGCAGGAAARCCHLLDAPARVQAPPRPGFSPGSWAVKGNGWDPVSWGERGGA